MVAIPSPPPPPPPPHPSPPSAPPPHPSPPSALQSTSNGLAGRGGGQQLLSSSSSSVLCYHQHSHLSCVMKVGVVIAHPDDEAMFFVPTLEVLGGAKRIQEVVVGEADSLAADVACHQRDSSQQRGTHEEVVCWVQPWWRCCLGYIISLFHYVVTLLYPPVNHLEILKSQSTSSVEFYILCMSTGNVSGEGPQRVRELAESAFYLGVTSVVVVDDIALPDSMAAHWSPNRVGQYVQLFVESFGIQTVLTFDAGGVSHHPNHLAVHHGVRSFWKKTHCSKPEKMLSRRMSKQDGVDESMLHYAGGCPVRCWKPKNIDEGEGRPSRSARCCCERVMCLETTGLLRKYTGPLELLLPWIRCAMMPKRDMVVATSWRPWKVWRAMSLHTSQFVYYRKLFVIFSRYAYVNTLFELSPS
eukprot:GHVS01035555.1.p2 GENE.GHVS01035555.1~~GHVS01035555.1.p2  ORF type:complete len:413 (-),score=94.79 GHVS01035555.1:1482-2720(-)